MEESSISTIPNPVGQTNFQIDHASHTTHKLMATPQVFVGHHRVFEDMLNYVIKPGIVTPFVLFGSVGAGKTAVMMRFQDYYDAARKRARVKTISYAPWSLSLTTSTLLACVMALCLQVLLRLQLQRRAQPAATASVPLQLHHDSLRSRSCNA